MLDEEEALEPAPGSRRGSGAEDASPGAETDLPLDEPPPEAASPRKKDKNGVIEALVLVLIALVLALTLKTYVAEAYEIRGKSMKKTFDTGNRVVVLKAFYSIGRGDIVVFSSSEDPQKDLIKRVVGLPGELIKIAGGQVYIDGLRIDESYAEHDEREFRETPLETRIREDEYYVLGDNRPDSHDSRSFGPIPASSIKGKVIICWWPIDRLASY